MNDNFLIWENYKKTKFKNIKSLKIKPPSDNIDLVAQSNDLNIKKILEIVPISKISYTINLNDAKERERINDLKKQIQKNNYISRIVVDSSNTIIEGQHRFQAIKELGFESIPVVKLFGIDYYITNIEELHKKLSNLKLHPDHIYRLINMVAEIISDEKGNIEELYNYEPPNGFEKAWDIIINHINS